MSDFIDRNQECHGITQFREFLYILIREKCSGSIRSYYSWEKFRRSVMVLAWPLLEYDHPYTEVVSLGHTQPLCALCIFPAWKVDVGLKVRRKYLFNRQ